MDNPDDTPEKALPHVLTALLAKRKELERAIYVLNNQLRTATHDLDVVKAALTIFKGDRQLPAHSITRPAVASFRGAPMQAVFTAMRVSPVPLSTECLTQIVMKKAGLPLDDPKLCRAMQRRVRTSLNYYRRVRGIFRSVPGPNRSLLWEIAIRLDDHAEPDVVISLVKGRGGLHEERAQSAQQSLTSDCAVPAQFAPRR